MHLMVTDSYLQAQYKNLLIQAEMMELRTRVRLSSNYTFQSMSDCKMHILYCGKMHQKLGNYFHYLCFQLGEMPEGDKNSILEQLDTAERVAMEERLESSYRQIREYQDTLYQSQEQMDGARAFIESSEVSLVCC